MSKRRLVITAVLTGQSQSHVARTYGVSQGWISRLMARYRAEGEAAFEPRSRAPHHHPRATPPDTVEVILRLRKQLLETGLDAGADTIAWHLQHTHRDQQPAAAAPSRATIHRILQRAGAVVPQPAKRPKSSYVRFAAEQPNETWQSDVTHYPLASAAGAGRNETAQEVEILTWLDDCSRYALSVTAHTRVTGTTVRDAFRQAVDLHGCPASTLTDNGMVFTTRHSGGKGGRNHLEHELRARNVVQKNGTPYHPQTQGKVERFQQTLKKWLTAQQPQPVTVEQLQALLDAFVAVYNTQRPHRSLPHRATPATVYTNLPKASPASHGADRSTDTHDRVRRDRIDASGKITLRYAGRLRSIGIGRTHARTRVLVLAHDRHVTVLDAATGEVLRDLTLDPTRDYQPTGKPRDRTPIKK
jgi:transposase InsO family protein